MKILFILPEYYPHSGGGISTYYLNYIKALKSSVGEIKVLVGSGYIQSDETHLIDGIFIEYLKPEIYKRYLQKFSKFDLQPEYRNNIAASWAMWEQSNFGEGFDAIECTDFGLGFIPWLVEHKTPVVIRLHGSTGQIDLFEHYKTGLTADLHRQAEIILLEKADKIISHSIANKVYWENVLHRKDIEVIYPIYDHEIIETPYAKKEDYGIVCARVQEWKGPDVLCEALSSINTENIKVKWFGKDTPFDETISKSAQLKRDYPKIWEKIVLRQLPLPHIEIMLAQQKAKFAIIPSTWDMFNFTGLEYLNAGTVLICSDGAGVAELIEDGVNGFVFEGNNAQALANCIKKVMQLSPEALQEIVNLGKATLKEQLNTSAIVEANIDIYKNVMPKPTTFLTNDFNIAFFKPSEKQYTLNDTLKNVSIKALASHLYKRILKKF